ncbi:MAG: ATP-dependent DNA ligase [Firmicutes bacterium]|nr:ATP-dependent DNA ligase [Bacillota bacterium]
MEIIKPMDPILKSNFIKDEEWIHQVKWDGIRGITFIDKKNVNVFTKNGRNTTENYPELKELSKLIKGKKAILDGEIIVLSKGEKPSFKHSLIRQKVSNKDRLKFFMKKYPIKYIVFDMLMIDDYDIRDYSFIERKEKLNKILNENEKIAITEDFNNGKKLFELMKKRKWEGIVSKRLSSKYVPGKKHNDWYKIKITRKILAIVLGVELKKDNPKSLILGLYKEGEIKYIGKASIGLKEKEKNLIKEYIPKLKGGDFNTFNLKGSIVYFKTFITCWVKFMEWTHDGLLRNPRIIGFSDIDYKKALGRETIL